jgi:hypothetical protein
VQCVFRQAVESATARALAFPMAGLPYVLGNNAAERDAFRSARTSAQRALPRMLAI